MNTYNDATPIDQEVDELAKDDLEGYTGPTWTTETLMREYEVLAFAAPFVVVRRKSDNKRGTVEFRHWPRTYFAWKSAA